MSPKARPPHLPFLKGVPSFEPGLDPVPVAQWLIPDTEADAWLRDKCLIMKMTRPECCPAARWTARLAKNSWQ